MPPPSLPPPSPLLQHFDAERQPDGDAAVEPLDAARVGGGLRRRRRRRREHALLDAVGNEAGLGD